MLRWAADRRDSALRFALVHWLLLVLLQCGLYFGYVTSERPWAAAVKWLPRLPFLQSSNLLFVSIIGLLVWLAAGRRSSLWTAWTVSAVSSLLLVIDALYYKLFFSHLQFGATGAIRRFDIGMTASSVTSEFDRTVAFLAACAACAAAYLAFRIVRPAPFPVRRPALILAALLGLAGIPMAISGGSQHLAQNPFFAMAIDLAQRPLPPPAVNGGAPPLTGEFDRDPRLPRLAGNPDRRPNVLLISLESVGGVQLLDEAGAPREAVTPNLAALARQAAVFPSLYTIYPGTTRSLLFLHTGGRSVTWGEDFDMAHPYEGATLGRVFQKRGYRTGLISSARLDSESTDVVLRPFGFDTFYHAGEDPRLGRPEFMHNSWGAREEMIQPKLEEFIDRSAAAATPFLLVYMNVATHHPYGVPPGEPAPFSGDGRKSDYLNALHYTDAAIGRLLRFLDSRGLRQNTVIAVTGDHGQAFGDRHEFNFIHRSEIYEENIRTFLLLAPPQAAGLVSNRIGSAGDILPTVAAAAGVTLEDVPGRSLLAESYEMRPVLFHTNIRPLKWGLRDGRWKLIAGLPFEDPRLYDLTADPLEQKDLAASRPAQVQTYRRWLERWFVETDRDFTSHLRNLQPHPLDLDQVLSRGPKYLETGLMKGGIFTQQAVFHPDDRVAAHVKWSRNTLPADRLVSYTSPTGVVHQGPAATTDFDMVYFCPGPFPLETGDWSVQIKQDQAILLHQRFRVEPAVKTR